MLMRLEKLKKIYKLKPKKLVLYGFPRLDTLIQERQKTTQEPTQSKRINFDYTIIWG